MFLQSRKAWASFLERDQTLFLPYFGKKRQKAQTFFGGGGGGGGGGG